MEANPPTTAQELAEELWAVPSQWAFGAHWKKEDAQKVHLLGADGKIENSHYCPLCSMQQQLPIS